MKRTVSEPAHAEKLSPPDQTTIHVSSSGTAQGPGYPEPRPYQCDHVTAGVASDGEFYAGDTQCSFDELEDHTLTTHHAPQHHVTSPSGPVTTSGRQSEQPHSELEQDLRDVYQLSSTKADVPSSSDMLYPGAATSYGEGCLEMMDIAGPQSELLVGKDSTQAERDLNFLQSATHFDSEYLKHLYFKCNCDLERAIDVAVTQGPLGDTSDSDYGSEDMRPVNSDSDPESASDAEREHLGAPSESTTKDTMPDPDESNLVLKLSTSLATQLQQLFGEIDKALLSDGTCMHMYM